MKNEKLWRRFQRVLETPSATFRYFQTSCFTITLHYPFLSTAIPPFPPSPPLFAIPRPPHHPNSKSTANGGHHNYSLFIFHHSFSLITANPAPPQFFIFHFSFIKAPPSPLSLSFLSAPFSHFLTASYCCRAHRSPTACSLSFSCRPLSSPRFS